MISFIDYLDYVKSAFTYKFPLYPHIPLQHGLFGHHELIGCLIIMIKIVEAEAYILDISASNASG